MLRVNFFTIPFVRFRNLSSHSLKADKHLRKIRFQAGLHSETKNYSVSNLGFEGLVTTMPGTLDLDFIKVKRKTRSQPATPKGSPTRETGGDLISDSKNGSSKSVDKKTLRKSSDDGRYLFIKDRGDKLVSLQSHQSTPSSSPSTPVTNLAEPIAPRRSKLVRTFVESALGDPSPPEKLKDQTGTRVSKVCVILNDAELLVVSMDSSILSFV